MRCAEARRRMSLAFDGETDVPVDPAAGRSIDAALGEHVRDCDDCAAFERTMLTTRHELRDRDTGPVPDILAGVWEAVAAEETGAGAGRWVAPTSTAEPPSMVPTGLESTGLESRERVPDSLEPTELETRRRSRRDRSRAGGRSWVPVAACVLVGLLVGGGLVSNRATPPSAAATIPERVASAQFDLASLTADLDVTEHGWHADVPTRTFTGDLSFSSPELLSLHLRDTTSYPSEAWAPNHVTVVVRADGWWSSGSRDCPGAVQSSCTTSAPRVSAVVNREPFDAGTPAPLDLAVPVVSFDRAGQPEVLGTRMIGGREAVGVVTSAAQVESLLDGLRTAGNLRHFFPTDRVELWLDQQALVPLAIRVIASGEFDRRTWQINRGYADQAGATLFEMELRHVVINGEVAADRFAPVPPDAARRDATFAATIDPAAAAAKVVPATAPDGLSPSRAGTAGAGTPTEAVVRTWSRGRSWVKVRVSDRWQETRLFGDLGAVVRTVTLADGSTAYTDDRGSRVAVHGRGIDVVVEGSLPADRLLRIASSLGVPGLPVPSDWSDAATGTIADGRRLVPGLLVAVDPIGFGAPAVRTDGNVVTLAYAGAGSRSFVLIGSPGNRLTPPLDMDVTGVQVRGVAGRYSHTRGELEWVEGPATFSLRSSTLSLGELLAVARTLGPP